MTRLFTFGALLSLTFAFFRADAMGPDVMTISRDGKAQVRVHPFSVPQKALILTGDTAVINKDVYAVFYNGENMAFGDLVAPRFQFIDRKGTTVFGIGGAAEVYGYGDFGGTVNQYEFDVWKIPMGKSALQHSNIGGTPSQSSIFLKLATQTRFGVLTMYMSADFSGGTKGNNFELKQAYVALNGFTLGYTHSIFSDPAATVPTIDPFGPIGTINKRNMLAAYRYYFTKKFYGTLSVELPTGTYTNNPDMSTASLGQRVPDIPINLQYTWYSGSHIRVAGILRNLPYRDVIAGKNHIVTGYGVQVSGMASALGLVDFLYQVSYGKGIGYYVKGLAGEGVDLVYTDTPGQMKMPSTLAFVTGLRFNPNQKFFCSVAYSMARLYDQDAMGPDMFRRGFYVDANAFYMPVNDLQIGLGYIHGSRCNMDKTHGKANRIEAMIKYIF